MAVPCTEVVATLRLEAGTLHGICERISCGWSIKRPTPSKKKRLELAMPLRLLFKAKLPQLIKFEF